MRHLAPETLVTLAESPEAPSDAHLRDCDQCRRAVDELRAALAAARQDIVPEPSPLFWDRFSARVADEVAEDGERKRRPWSRALPASRLLRAAWVALPILVLAVAFGMRFWRSQTPAPAPTVAAEQTPGTEALAPEEAADASWALVMELAEDLDWDAAAEMGAVPGSAEEAVVRLSSAEQSELVHLIRLELQGPPM